MKNYPMSRCVIPFALGVALDAVSPGDLEYEGYLRRACAAVVSEGEAGPSP